MREGLRGVTGTSGRLIGGDDFTVGLAHPLLQRPAERRGVGVGGVLSLVSILKYLKNYFDD